MIKIFRNLLKNKIAQNAGWLFLGNVAQLIITFVIGILTARFLGPSNYGIINYGNAYQNFFLAISSLGMNSIILKELVNMPEDDGEILGTGIRFRLTASVLSLGIITLISSLVDRGEHLIITVTFLCSTVLVFQTFEIFKLWFQSRLLGKKIAISCFLAYLISSAYKVYLLASGKPVIWFAVTATIDNVFAAVFLYYNYRKSGGGKLSFNMSRGISILRQSYHFILSAMMIAMYNSMDKFMLKQMLSETEVGYYSTAANLSTIWCFVLNSLIESMTPSIIESYHGDRNVFNRNNKLLYSMIFYISSAVALFFTLFGRLIIPVLYGEAYAPSVRPLVILSWLVAFSYMGVARNAWVVCEDKQKYLKYIFAAAALFNLILNYVMIPVWGASGAALASLLTQLFTSIFAPLLIKPMRENALLMLRAMNPAYLISTLKKLKEG